MAIKIDEVFYELKLRTDALPQGVARAERDFKKLAKAFKDHPERGVIGGAGLMAAAIGAVGLQATKMAEEVNKNLRKVQSGTGATIADMKALRKTIEDISRTSPLTQEQLAAGAKQLKDSGEKDPAAIARGLRVAADLADASGMELQRIIESLDLVTDAFRRTLTEAGDDLTRVYAIAKDKVPLEDLLDVMQRSSSTLATFRVGAVDAAKGITAMIDAGMPSKQAANALPAILEQVQAAREKIPDAIGSERLALEGLVRILGPANIAAKGLTGAIAELAQSTGGNADNLTTMGFNLNEVNAIMRVGASAAATARSATDELAEAQKKLRNAATDNRAEISNLSQIIKNNLNAELIRLGNVTGPPVLKLLRGMADILSPATTRARELSEAIDRIGSGKGAERPGLLERTVRRAPGPIGDVARFLAPGQAGEEDPLGTIRRGFKEHGATLFADVDMATLNRIADAIQKTTPKDSDVRLQKDMVAAMAARVMQLEAIRAKEEEAHAAEVLAAQKEQERLEKQRQADEAATRALEAKKDATQRLAAIRQEIESDLLQNSAPGVARAQAELKRALDEEATIRKAKGKEITLDEERTLLERRLLKQQAVEHEKQLLNEVIAKEKEAAALTIREIIAESTSTQVDNLQLALDKMVAELEDANAEAVKANRQPLYSEQQIAQVRALGEEFIRVTGALESFDKGLTALKDRAGDASTEDEIKLLEKQVLHNRVQLTTKLALTHNDAARAEILERINALDEIGRTLAERRTDLQKKVAKGVLDEKEAAEERRKVVIDTVRGIEEAARAALQLAEAFGIVDGRAARMVQSIVQAGGGIARIAAGDALGGGLQLAGGLASIIGSNRKELHDRTAAVIEKNSELLAKLNDSIARLVAGLTGEQLSLIGRVGAALSAAFASGAGAEALLGSKGLIVENLGVDAAEAQKLIEEVAKLTGVELDSGSIFRYRDSLVTLNDAIKKFQLQELTSTVDGALSMLQLRWKLFKVENPIEQFSDYIEVLATKGAKVFGALDNIDLSSEEGRSAATSFVQKMFEQLAAGTIDPSVLGSLTPEQFKSALDEINRRIEEATPGLRTLADALSDLDVELDIMDASLEERVRRAAETAAEFSPALAQILDGIDLADPEDVKLLDERIRALYEQMKNAPDSVDAGTVSIAELLQALLALESGLDQITAASEQAAEAAARAAEEEERRAAEAAKAAQRKAFDEVERGLRIFDATPEQRLKKLAEYFNGLSPAIAEALGGINFSTAEGREAMRSALQQLYTAIMDPSTAEAALQGMDPDELAQIIEHLLGAIGDVPIPEAPVPPDRIKKLRERWQLFNVDSPIDQLIEQAEKLGEISPAFARILDGVDVTTIEGVEEFNRRLQALYEQLELAPETVETGELSIEALIEALLGLSDHADRVADSILSAAAKMDAAISELNRELDVKGITDPVERIRRMIDAVGEFAPAIREALDGVDLASEGGRTRALELLMQIFDQARAGADVLGDLEREKFEELIAQLTRSIRDVPSEIVEAQEKTPSDETDFVKSARGISEYTGMRMADYLNTLVMHTRHVDENTKALLASLASYRTPPGLTPPPMPLSTSGVVMAPEAGMRVSIRFGNVTINVNGAGASAEDIGAAVQNGLSQLLLDQVEAGLGRKVVDAKRRRGDTEILI